MSWVNFVLNTKGFNSINVTFVSNQTPAFSQPFKIDADYSLFTFKGTFLFYSDKQSGITFYHLNNHSFIYSFILGTFEPHKHLTNNVQFHQDPPTAK